jgi:hypothetical protein
MFVCCEYCVLSGRGLCDGLIIRPEESYRRWRVVVCDQETSKTRRLKPATGLWKIQTQWVVTPRKQRYIYIYIYSNKTWSNNKYNTTIWRLRQKVTKLLTFRTHTYWL